MEKDLKDITIKLFNCFENWDFATISSLCRSDIVWELYALKPLSGKYIGIERVISFLEQLKSSFSSGLTFEFKQIIREDNTVAVYWKNRSVNLKGGNYENCGVNIIFFDNSCKIQSIIEFVDSSPLNDTLLRPL